MRAGSVLLAALLALVVPSFAAAQVGEVIGERAGATVGGAVGGPAGAVVGGTAGAIVGGVIEPEVRSFVAGETGPSVRVQGSVEIGGVLPDAVTLRAIPKADKFRFAIVNDKRVIVEQASRKIVQIVE